MEERWADADPPGREPKAVAIQVPLLKDATDPGAWLPEPRAWSCTISSSTCTAYRPSAAAALSKISRGRVMGA